MNTKAPLAMLHELIPDHISVSGELTAVGTVVGVMFGWLPGASAGLAIVWYALMIYDSRPLRAWRARRRAMRFVTSVDSETPWKDPYGEQ